MATDSLVLSERLARLEQFRPMLIRTANRHSASRHDAQDAVQDALLRVAGVDDLDWARVEGLLVTVVRNICIDQIRASQRRVSRDDRYARCMPAISDAGTEDIFDRAEAAWFRQKLTHLVPQERRIIELLADGQPLVDIARSEGISYKAAHSSLSRARRTLAAMWRATLALVGLGWLRRRASAASGMSAMAVISLTIAGVPFVHWPSDQLPTPREPTKPITQIHEDADVTPIPGAHRLSVHTPHVPAHKSHVILRRLGRGQTNPGTPVSVTHESLGEPVYAAIVRCVSKGVEIGIEYIGCQH